MPSTVVWIAVVTAVNVDDRIQLADIRIDLAGVAESYEAALEHLDEYFTGLHTAIAGPVEAGQLHGQFEYDGVNYAWWVRKQRVTVRAKIGRKVRKMLEKSLADWYQYGQSSDADFAIDTFSEMAGWDIDYHDNGRVKLRKAGEPA